MTQHIRTFLNKGKESDFDQNHLHDNLKLSRTCSSNIKKSSHFTTARKIIKTNAARNIMRLLFLSLTYTHVIYVKAVWGCLKTSSQTKIVAQKRKV